MLYLDSSGAIIAACDPNRHHGTHQETAEVVEATRDLIYSLFDDCALAITWDGLYSLFVFQCPPKDEEIELPKPLKDAGIQISAAYPPFDDYGNCLFVYDQPILLANPYAVTDDPMVSELYRAYTSENTFVGQNCDELIDIILDSLASCRQRRRKLRRSTRELKSVRGD